MASVMVVELTMRASTGQVVPQARFVLDGASVRTVVLSPPAKEQIEEIIERGLDSGGRWLWPSDGEAFLELLPRLYAGSRLWATPPFEMDFEDALGGGEEITQSGKERGVDG